MKSIRKKTQWYRASFLRAKVDLDQLFQKPVGTKLKCLPRALKMFSPYYKSGFIERNSCVFFKTHFATADSHSSNATKVVIEVHTNTSTYSNLIVEGVARGRPGTGSDKGDLSFLHRSLLSQSFPHRFFPAWSFPRRCFSRYVFPPPVFSLPFFIK